MQKHTNRTEQTPQYRVDTSKTALQRKNQDGLASFEDNRPSAIAQAKMWEKIHRDTASTSSVQFKNQDGSLSFKDNRPSAIAQAKMWEKIRNNTSSKDNFQFKTNYTHLEPSAQRMAWSMEPHPSVQRNKKEDLLQGKFKGKHQSIQRVEKEEEEDLLQGKFKGKHRSIQRVEKDEEEDLLQGKFKGKHLSIQRVEKEEEEGLLQGKFKSKHPSVQRVEKDEEEDLLQGKFKGKSPQNPIQKQEQESKPNNTGLPDKLKSGIENLSGYSMDDVSVHYNSSKPAQLQAHAYAQGTDIHLGSGQEKHLPHEAWHVVQQKQGRVKPTMQMKGVGVNDDVGLEKEADVMGEKALQMKYSENASLLDKERSLPKYPVQLVITNSAFFDQKTTIPKNKLNIFGSDNRLTGIIEALEAYEKSESLDSLKAVYKACNSASTSDKNKKQLTAIMNLKIEVATEIKILIPATIEKSLGENPSEGLFKAIRDGYNYSDVGIDKDVYKNKVEEMVVDSAKIKSIFDQFMITKPDLKKTDKEFIKSFETYAKNGGKKITQEAIPSIESVIKAERAKQEIKQKRKQDRDKLSGMLEVNDDLLKFDPKPNDVNSEEFEELVNLYTGIREGTSHIKFSNKSRTNKSTIKDNQMDAIAFDKFKSGTLDDISKMMQTPQGRTVLKALHSGGKTGGNTYNIAAASNALDAGAGPDNLTNSEDGTSTGGTVYYKPNEDINSVADVYTTSDTALMHEMIHAYHFSQGTAIPRNKKVDDLNKTDKKDLNIPLEEYATVGLGPNANDEITENSYRSSRRLLDKNKEKNYLERKRYVS